MVSLSELSSLHKLLHALRYYLRGRAAVLSPGSAFHGLYSSRRPEASLQTVVQARNAALASISPPASPVLSSPIQPTATGPVAAVTFQRSRPIEPSLLAHLDTLTSSPVSAGGSLRPNTLPAENHWPEAMLPHFGEVERLTGVMPEPEVDDSLTAAVPNLEESPIPEARSDLFLAITANQAPPSPTGTSAISSGSTNPLFSNLTSADTFLLHSRPTASKRIFLDFDGYSLASSAFAYGAALKLSAYKPATGNLAIEVQQIWSSLAEFFSPFDVDVTTQDPGSDRLIKTNSNDTAYGIRAVFSADQINGYSGQRIAGVAPGTGGLAPLYGFGNLKDEPALIFITSGSYDAAVAAAHEIGHTLGLTHQGTSSVEYYSGHGGTAVTSWCPILGTPYLDNVRENLITWSNGSYFNATNTQDELAVITTNNGFGYRPDDAGNSPATAKPLTGTSFQQFGIIERNTDLDFYSFVTGPGRVSLQITNAVQAWIASGSVSGDPYLNQTYSSRLVSPFLSSLDIGAKLFDAKGTLIATSNPADSLSATFDITLPAGQYFVSVDGVGFGDPFASSPTGYTDYGILGQYVIAGLVQDVNGLAISAASPLLTSENGGSARFQVALISKPTNSVRLNVSSDNVSEGRPNTTTLDFNAGNWSVPQTVFVTGQDDRLLDGPVAYNIVLDPSPSVALEYRMLSPRRVAAINSDNDLPSLSLSGPTAMAVEGRDSKVNFVLNLNSASSLPVSVTLSTLSGTATAALDYVSLNATVVIPSGQTQLLVPITLINDSIAEPDESFSVKISAVTNATLTGPGQASASISDAITTSTTTTLPAGVDILRLTGNGAINGTGNTGPNQIIGNGASNVLKGGGGIDVLTGMGGLDSFDLTGISSKANTATITDFITGAGGENLLLSNSLTTRLGGGAAVVRTISSLSASTLTLDTGGSGSAGYDLFLVNPPITKVGVDLSTSGTGSKLLDGLFSGTVPVNLKTTTAAGMGYIGAYDNDNFYLYWFSAGAGDTTVSSAEIQLIAVLDSTSPIAPGALVASNIQLA